MFYKLLRVSILLSFTHGWALHCSPPETVSDQRLDASESFISSNEKGDVLLTWLSSREKSERLEVSCKTQNSLWSFPEPISSWEKSIYDQRCFVNAQGNLFAIWQTEKEDKGDFFHVAEKLKENSWNFYLNWAHMDDALFNSDAAADSAGNLILIGAKKISYKPEPYSQYAYKNTIPAVALYTKQAGKFEQNLDTSPSHPGCYSISDIKIAVNKNGIGSAFWISYALEKYSLMHQRIVNNKFVMKPEIIDSFQDFIHDVAVMANEKGDILVAYCDSKSYGKIITKIQDVWSKPFLFSEKEDISSPRVAIDNAGNMMVVWEAEIDESSVVKTIYKSVCNNWENPILFAADNASNWNPNVQPDGAGNFVVIWQQEQRRRNSIFGRVFSTTSQSWSNPQRLSPELASCFGHTYTFWAPGRGYIAWTMCPNGYDKMIQVAELSH